MNRSFARGFLLAPILVMCVALAGARAEPYFVPLDGSDKDYRPKDFGYRIETKTVGGLFRVLVELDEAAARSFRGAELSLSKDGHVIVTTAFGLERVRGKTAYLNIALDPKTIDDGEVYIRSGSVAGSDRVKNFAGFSISIKTLLSRAK